MVMQQQGTCLHKLAECSAELELCLLAGASQRLTASPLLPLNLPGELLLLQKGQCVILHISGLWACPRFVATVKSKAKIL